MSRICRGLTAERINPVPEARELLHSNLHEVFSERDPGRRWAAMERTYTEDVRFVDTAKNRPYLTPHLLSHGLPRRRSPTSSSTS